MMVVGMPCGTCTDCGKQAYSMIAGKPYCYECGESHIQEVVDATIKELGENK